METVFTTKPNGMIKMNDRERYARMVDTRGMKNDHRDDIKLMLQCINFKLAPSSVTFEAVRASICSNVAKLL